MWVVDFAIPCERYPAFEALKAISLFMHARAAHNTVAWIEEVDMVPENLYLESASV